MDPKNKGAQKIKSRQIPFIRRSWLNIVLLVLAALSITAGTYLGTRPDWTKRSDIQEYNLGISNYKEIPTRQGAGITEKAVAHFEKALIQSNDQKVKALALCNIGTVNGKLALGAIRNIQEAYAVRRIKGVENDENLLIARQEIRKAIQKLAEAVRIDPTLEDAKFNLELLEQQRGEGAVIGPRYSSGQVDKGY